METAVHRPYHNALFPRMSLNSIRKAKYPSIESPSELLPEDFEPGEWDVICQRGKECYEHVGNRNFRATIGLNVERYTTAPNRQAKSEIIKEIVAITRRNASSTSNGGGFVIKDLISKRWYRVDDKLAREKCGQALRDTIKSRKLQQKKRSRSAQMISQMSPSQRLLERSHAATATAASASRIRGRLREENPTLSFPTMAVSASLPSLPSMQTSLDARRHAQYTGFAAAIQSSLQNQTTIVPNMVNSNQNLATQAVNNMAANTFSQPNRNSTVLQDFEPTPLSDMSSTTQHQPLPYSAQEECLMADQSNLPVAILPRRASLPARTSHPDATPRVQMPNFLQQALPTVFDSTVFARSTAILDPNHNNTNNGERNLSPSGTGDLSLLNQPDGAKSSPDGHDLLKEIETKKRSHSLGSDNKGPTHHAPSSGEESNITHSSIKSFEWDESPPQSNEDV